MWRKQAHAQAAHFNLASCAEEKESGCDWMWLFLSECIWRHVRRHSACDLHSAAVTCTRTALRKPLEAFNTEWKPQTGHDTVVTSKRWHAGRLPCASQRKKICSNELSDLPAAEAINITNYLGLQTSDHTVNHMHTRVFRLTTVLNSKVTKSPQ